MRIYFIVYGNVKIGMGHIMRSISLAGAFKIHGHKVIFFSKYEQGISLLQKAGMEICRILSETYSGEQGFFMENQKNWKKI